jgi:hypothetical protein
MLLLGSPLYLLPSSFLPLGCCYTKKYYRYSYSRLNMTLTLAFESQHLILLLVKILRKSINCNAVFQPPGVRLEEKVA